MTGSEVGNFAHSIFLWDRFLKPYQSSSSFFSEFTAPEPNPEAMQKPGLYVIRIDTGQVMLVLLCNQGPTAVKGFALYCFVLHAGI